MKTDQILPWRPTKNIEFIRCFISIAFIILLTACEGGVEKNRLASAASPYLRQHADNPVNWYEWGDQALSLAKKENKPLLISIGYASCHWCHQMEKESFMDTSIARIMNENFICIKVDREERPDIDNVYMYACRLLSGGTGGWPLNAFALPDGKPFFAGTYYAKNSWRNLLMEISKAFTHKNAVVVKQAEALTRGVADEAISFQRVDSISNSIGRKDYQDLFDTVYSLLDTANGGIRSNLKFPMASVSEYLLQYYYVTGSEKAYDIASTTLTKMALGGIYDQIGGGFARYATDPQWRIPHFEKMLYDNAQLISVYAHAYQLSKDEFYKRIMTETISFVELELSSRSGGFYSSCSAGSESGEGGFYAWSEKEFKNIVGNDNILSEYYNINPEGNWKNGRNILLPIYSPTEFAKQKGLTTAHFFSLLDDSKAQLLIERNKRTKPPVDNKIVASWNAMLLKAYTDAFLATSEQRYLERAFSIADFLEKEMLGKDGSIKRIFTNGRVTVDGFLDDYAWTAYAFVKLYQASFEKHWLDLANKIAEFAMNHNYDKGSGMFHYSALRNSKLVVNDIETTDDAIPSSNSIMANVLYSLGILYNRSDYVDLSQAMLNAMSRKMKVYPVNHTSWLTVAGTFANGTFEVAVMGKDAVAVNRNLQKHYLPDCIMMGETDEENLPLLENKLVDNKTLIYVCNNKVCKKPVEEVSEALMQIKNRYPAKTTNITVQ